MIAIHSSFRAASLAFAVLGCASGAALADDTQAAWNGLMQITTATATCATDSVGGTGVGDIHVSVYRPHILTTDTPTYLSIMFTQAALTLQNSNESTNPHMTGSGAYTATVINKRGKPGTFVGAYSNISTSPTLVNGSTATVSITGTIDNVFNTSGCNVGFKAVYTKE